MNIFNIKDSKIRNRWLIFVFFGAIILPKLAGNCNNYEYLNNATVNPLNNWVSVSHDSTLETYNDNGELVYQKELGYIIFGMEYYDNLLYLEIPRLNSYVTLDLDGNILYDSNEPGEVTPPEYCWDGWSWEFTGKSITVGSTKYQYKNSLLPIRLLGFGKCELYSIDEDGEKVLYYSAD